MNYFKHNNQTLAYSTTGNGDTAIVWAHGWGHSGAALLPLAESLTGNFTHYVVDFPGFGQSPAPQTDWSVGDYAELLKVFIDSLPQQKRIWVGHSFGCRVGIKLAALYPGLFAHVFLMAAAGVPRKRSLAAKLKTMLRVRLFKLLKLLAPNEQAREKLRQKFGSRDYLSAGALRGTFMKVINENLGADAQKITSHVTLIYGTEDTETPVDVGQRFEKLMPNARLHVLPGLDHYTILNIGRHFVLQLIKENINQ